MYILQFKFSKENGQFKKAVSCLTGRGVALAKGVATFGVKVAKTF